MHSRFFVSCKYKGTNFHGWQKQQNAHSIQEEIETVLSKLYGSKIDIVGSGRTDRGVHASKQVFHMDLPDSYKETQLQFKMNTMLPRSISISSVQKVSAYAHARFDAISRAYIYRFSKEKDPFNVELTYNYPHEFNLELLQKASEILLGKQDFQCFSKTKTEVNNYICEIMSVSWKINVNEVEFHISANRFLRGMVRAVVGTLLMINENKLTIDGLKEIIGSKNRSHAGRSVPAQGLFLSEVNYPSHLFVNQ